MTSFSLRTWILAAAVSLTTCATIGAADVTDLLQQAKAVAGGESWDDVRVLRMRGQVRTSGFEGTIETLEDLRSGHSVTRFDLGTIRGAEGYDGTVPWNQDPSGDVTRRNSSEDLEGAATQAWLTARAYWFPQRRPGTLRIAREARDDSRRFHVIEVKPEGGRPFELWLDAESLRLDRTVETNGDVVTTTSYSDFRKVGDLEVPFGIQQSTGDSAHDTHVTIDSVDIDPEIGAKAFAPPEGEVDDSDIAGGKSRTTIPFELIDNHIYVDASVNGGKPIRFLVDTGGVNLLTKSAAAELGIESQGSMQGRGVGEKPVGVGIARLSSFKIGNAKLTQPMFFVLPMAELQVVEDVAFSGLIGFEVFKRFVVEIDYAACELTLHDAESFQYEGNGVRVPFKLSGRTPEVEGEIDGLPGVFSIDTGSRASLDVMGPFAAKNDFEGRYSPELEAVTGWGVGGSVRSKVTRARELRLGDVAISDLVMAISMNKKGAFADQYRAGNVGGGVLKRFHVIFDYTNRVMILERNELFGTADTFDRTGMWLNRSPAGFRVEDVVAEGPAAAAGLRVGDDIVAVDGVAAAELRLAAVRDQLRNSPPGTRVVVTVQREGVPRKLPVVLRELLPPKKVDKKD